MNTQFTETQYGWVSNTFFTITLLILSLAYYFQWGSHPLKSTTFVLICCILFIAWLLFYRLRTEVTNDKIKISFGIGLIQKDYPLVDIKAVRQVKNQWYYGWGIRLLKNGWLYNMNGLNAVELIFKNKYYVVRIGTSDSNKLADVIKQVISDK